MNAGEATLDATTQFTLTTLTFESNSTDTDFITDTFDVIADSSIKLTATAAGASYSLAFQEGFITDNSGNGHGIKYTDDYSSGFVNNSLMTKKYVDDQIDIITASDIEEITAGNGLTGGGTQGTVDVAVGDGAGIQVNANSIEVDITTGGGLTFSAAGAAGSLEVEVDGTTIGIVNGALTAIGGSAQPVYQLNTSITAVGANNNGAATGMRLTSEPSDYSRIEVYVNGQRQLLGENTTSDCWFGEPANAYRFNNLNANDELIWNSESAGFRLEESDRVEIVYEA